MKNERILNITKRLDERQLKYPENLELFDDPIDMRPLEEIAKRAIISAIVSICAFSLPETDYPDVVKEQYLELLEKYGLQGNLFEREHIVMYEDYAEAVCNEISWQTEAAIALLWALNIIDNIDDALDPEDVDAQLDMVLETLERYSSFDEFLSVCELRSEEEIADIFQTYWYYHWNLVDGMIFGNAPDTVSISVVCERRRGLQWLLYSETDENGEWNFQMHT